VRRNGDITLKQRNLLSGTVRISSDQTREIIAYQKGRTQERIEQYGLTSSSSAVAENKTGGIDFDPANLNLNVEGNVFFNLPLETIRRFQTSTGMTFQILKIEKGVDLESLLVCEQEFSLSP